MIKNEKQYKITVAQANSFAKALENLDEMLKNEQPILAKAQKDALQSQYDDLTEEIREYEALKAGKFNVLEIRSFADLPKGLIRARIASGMSQKDLAERLGLKEQQIQRYEASEYSTASFDRIIEVVKALDLQIKNEILISETLVAESRLFSNLRNIGFDKDFVLKKILPPRISSVFDHTPQPDSGILKRYILEAASIIGKIFRLNEKEILNPVVSFDLEGLAFGATRYKKAINSNAKRLNAYTIYAHIIALNVLEATNHLEQKEIPESPLDVKQEIINKYGSMTFENAVNYIWSLGIPVIPFKEFLNFNGACWRVDGRNVIAIKKKTDSEANWLFDLLHELRHAAQHPEADTLEIVEPDLFYKGMQGEDDEVDANDFAAEVLLGEKADDLAYESIMRAKRDLPRLKTEVQKIAREANVDVGVLANYIAFRLSIEQNKNWWGVANNLQQGNTTSFDSAIDRFLENVRLTNLNEFDRELVTRALN